MNQITSVSLFQFPEELNILELGKPYLLRKKIKTLNLIMMIVRNVLCQGRKRQGRKNLTLCILPKL